MAAPSMPPLVGVMTNAAKEINVHLRRYDIPPRVTRFLRHLETVTFGDAGLHRQWGDEDPGTWATFDLSGFTNKINEQAVNCLDKHTVSRIRDRLLADHIIWFESDPQVPGRGRIGWNFNYEEWTPRACLQESWGGKREGAGRKASKNVNLNTEATEGESAIKMTRTVATNQFKMTHLPATNIIKMTRTAAIEALPERAGAFPRRGTEEENNEEGVRAPNGAAACAAEALSPVHQASFFLDSQKTTKARKPTRLPESKATKEQQETLWQAWESLSHTIRRSDMSAKERSRHYGAITRMIASGVTPEELAMLVAQKAQADAWKTEGVILAPEDIERNLSKLRPMVRGEVQKIERKAQKGYSHARHDGTWTGNHGADDELVIKC